MRDWVVGELGGGDVVELEVVDPGLGGGLYGGETLTVGGRRVRHRGLRCWVELAELLGCRLVGLGRCADAEFVRLRFEKLEADGAFHEGEVTAGAEKYGARSRFARIDKREEPTFLFALEAALRRVDPAPGAHVLDLGVNTGDELALLEQVVGPQRFDTLEVVGVDHSESAIARARERFAGHRCRLLVHDINALEELDLGRFDLLLSVGTIHSPSIHNAKQLVMRLVQQHLTPTGAVILGFPNCRFRGGELLHGARAPNYNHPELSLVLKDVDWCKRYLQQHRFRVTITGRHYLFVTATRIGLGSRRSRES